MHLDLVICVFSYFLVYNLCLIAFAALHLVCPTELVCFFMGRVDPQFLFFPSPPPVKRIVTYWYAMMLPIVAGGSTVKFQVDMIASLFKSEPFNPFEMTEGIR